MNIGGNDRDTILKKLRQLSKAFTGDIDQNEFARSVRGESDRGAVILASTMVDDALRERLEKHFANANSDERRKLFENGGPASSFASRILLAKAVGIIDAESAGNIDVIRLMRNACAHAQNDLNFDSEPLRLAFGLLVKEADPPVVSYPRAMMRDLFVVACASFFSTIRGGGIASDALEAIMPMVKHVTQGAPERWEK